MTAVWTRATGRTASRCNGVAVLWTKQRVPRFTGKPSRTSLGIHAGEERTAVGEQGRTRRVVIDNAIREPNFDAAELHETRLDDDLLVEDDGSPVANRGLDDGQVHTTLGQTPVIEPAP